MATLRRVPAILLCALFLPASLAQAPARQACLNPFPVIAPVHPGACFINTDLGVFLELDDGEEFLSMETFGSTDSSIRVQPRIRRVRSHAQELEAEIYYCPPGVTGKECTLGFGSPGAGAWLGTGRVAVNTELDPVFIDNVFIQRFTCPSTTVGQGIVTDLEGKEHDLRVLMIFVKTPRGDCHPILNNISVSP